MAIDREVMEGICRAPGGGGHNLTSMMVDNLKDPSTGVFVPQFEIVCSRCGASVKELGEVTKRRRSRKGEALPTSAATGLEHL